MDFVGPSRLLFDVTGLVAWYAFYPTPTGIQRVTERVLMAPDIVNNPRVLLVARVPGAHSFFVIDRALIHGLGHKDSHDASVRRIRRLYVSMLTRVPLVRGIQEMEWFQWKNACRAWLGLSFLFDDFGAGSLLTEDERPILLRDLDRSDVFVNMGDFWWYGRQSRVLAMLKAQHGFRVVQMVHDLFPLASMAWEPPLFRRKFARQFEGLAPLVDAWLVNSAYVGGELRRHLEQTGQPVPLIQVLTMGWETAAEPNRVVSDRDRDVLRGLGLPERGYFLQVGTIEPRKNHRAVVQAVETLQRKHGAKFPVCVFVGVKGWRSRPLLRQLEKNRFADGAIRWFNRINDIELAALYRGALFTVYPSFLEGWGLPVQESISYGVPCIASKAGAIPEAGLDLAFYVDPRDDSEIVNAIERYATEPTRLARARWRIAAWLERKDKLPSWNDAARAILELASERP
jgi:glycosyltransferase involved in cell wall biosynthesis